MFQVTTIEKYAGMICVYMGAITRASRVKLLKY